MLLKRAIDIDPKTDIYKFNLAVIYDKIGDYRNAMKYYDLVLKKQVSNSHYGEEFDNKIPILQIKQRVDYIKNKI